MLVLKTKVKLKSFNNTLVSPENCEPSENYWSLIGETGIIKKAENKHFRVLVQFDNSVGSKGLYCHNEIENSILILSSDLEIIS